MKLAYIFLLLLFSSNLLAYSISTGTHVPYFQSAQISNSGAKQTFDINPYIGIGTNIPMSASQYFLPEFGYSYYLDNPAGSRREVLFLHYNFGYVLSNVFLLRYGLTTHYYRIIGKGGTTTLANGNSTKAFVNPNRTSTTVFTTLNLGGDYFFDSKQKSIRFDLNMMSFRDFRNRMYNYLLTLNFYY